MFSRKLQHIRIFTVLLKKTTTHEQKGLKADTATASRVKQAETVDRQMIMQNCYVYVNVLDTVSTVM